MQAEMLLPDLTLPSAPSLRGVWQLRGWTGSWEKREG